MSSVICVGSNWCVYSYSGIHFGCNRHPAANSGYSCWAATMTLDATRRPLHSVVQEIGSQWCCFCNIDDVVHLVDCRKKKKILKWEKKWKRNNEMRNKKDSYLTAIKTMKKKKTLPANKPLPLITYRCCYFICVSTCACGCRNIVSCTALSQHNLPFCSLNLFFQLRQLRLIF